MSTQGSFSRKNPTIKRILKEASELSTSPSADYAAAPLEENLLEWHFSLRGPPAPSPYAGGIYHGRIVLPATYPLRPPSFRFLTPSGRFEVNREICLSISGHHEESWQPAWGIRTALVAIRSFMDSEAKGQVGGIDASKEARLRMAKDSRAWRCSGCGGRTNDEIITEREREVERSDRKPLEDEKVPHELKLGYRDELGKEKPESTGDSSSRGGERRVQGTSETVPTSAAASTVPTSNTIDSDVPSVRSSTAAGSEQMARTGTTLQTTQHWRRSQASTNWLDLAIGGIAAALAVMILRRLAHVI